MEQVNAKQVGPQFGGEKGATLLELAITFGLLGILLVLGMNLYMNMELFTRKKSAELAARNESLLFLHHMRKAYAIDLMDEDDLPRRMVPKTEAIFGNIVGKDGEIVTAITSLVTSVSVFEGTSGVEVFQFGNHCTDLPASLHGMLPAFDAAYWQKVFDKMALDYHEAGVLNCQQFLQDFRCGPNQVPYAEFQSGVKHLRVPQAMAPGGSWQSSKSSAVAAFVCETEKFAGDLRQIKDVTVFSATFDPIQKANPDFGERLRWQKYRMIMSVASPSDNVLFIKK